MRARGLQSLNISLCDLKSASLDVFCGDKSESDSWLELSCSPTQRYFPNKFAGSLAGEALVTGISGVESATGRFELLELLATAAAIRWVAGRPLNPPAQGMTHSYCGSILEQWELIRSWGLGEFIPTWHASDDYNNSDVCRTIYLRILHNHRLRCTNDAYRKDEFAIRVEKPSGGLCSCAFAGDQRQHLLFDAGVWREFHPPINVYGQLESCIEVIRDEHGVDFGTVEYFYAGRLKYWSTYPHLRRRHVAQVPFRAGLEWICDAVSRS